MDPLAITVWRNACFQQDARRFDNIVPEECDITDPQFRRGASLPDLSPYQTYPSLMNRGRLSNGRSYYAQCLAAEVPSGIICDYSGDLRQILEVTADNRINPSVYVVREPEEADDPTLANFKLATPTVNLEQVPAAADAAALADGTDSEITLVEFERRPFINRQPTGTKPMAMGVNLKQGSPESRCDQGNKALDFLCDLVNSVSMLWRFCTMVSTAEERSTQADILELAATTKKSGTTECGEDFKAFNVKASEAPALTSVDPTQYTFDTITSTQVLSSLDYLKNAPVAHFFDRENKILICITKNEGVKLCFENGFALELPPAVVPLIRLPTSSGKTLIYDVALGKPLPAKFQGWEGVETVIQTFHKST